MDFQIKLDIYWHCISASYSGMKQGKRKLDNRIENGLTDVQTCPSEGRIDLRMIKDRNMSTISRLGWIEDTRIDECHEERADTPKEK